MLQLFNNAKIAIVGGGAFCREFLETILNDGRAAPGHEVMGVADLQPDAPGLVYARERGIFTTDDYRRFFDIPGLSVLIELTKDDLLADDIRAARPAHLKVIDHFEAVTAWENLLIDSETNATLAMLRSPATDTESSVADIFQAYASRITGIIHDSAKYAVTVERGLAKHERLLSQIVDGLTIPTFVINRNHMVTHWNRALEKFTGVPAADVVGTNRQWAPFWPHPRPSMADVIVDQPDAAEIQRLYGTKWQPSALIEGAYEAEIFFPSLGDGGRWCFFTAAPIKSPDGSIIGAVETFWDTTDDKRAEAEKEHYTNELAALCAVYSVLNAKAGIDERITTAISEIQRFLAADSICIYLKTPDGRYQFAQSAGPAGDICRKIDIVSKDSIIHEVAARGEFTVYKDRPDKCIDEVCALEPEKMTSLAYVPIITKEKNAFGVIRIGTRQPEHALIQERSVLELIGNRIGVAVENAQLQDQVARSEEKYRSLFNNDPHPIFILDTTKHHIFDMNQRARISYGFSREDLLDMAFLALGDGDDEELAEGLKSLSTDQSLLFTKRRHYRKNRQPFFVNVNISRANYGERDVIIASITDISSSVEKEKQLIQASKMTTLGQMAAGMAHELNQPLNVIQICVDYLQKTAKKGVPVSMEELLGLTTDISGSVSRASGIIRHMRDFARQSEVTRRRINVNDPILDVFKVLGHQIKAHQIDLVLELAPDLPDIMAEHNRLEQVFINLVTNAVDAMDEMQKQAPPEYRKRLTIRSRALAGKVVVAVADNGIGITETVKDKIFEPFFTTKAVGKGTGLGVSISYGIVQDYDGTISIDSAHGTGTTFELQFPAAA
ncbi:MAG: ATP-binding protein [Pseudomonadota bacterium]